MATGGDHDPFFDDLSDIPDGSSAGTGFGWGEGLAAESSLRELSTRLSSAAFSRSGAPSPPIENPSEPRFEAPLYDIFAGGARSLDLDGGARSLDVALDQSDHVLAYLHTQREGAQSTGSAADALPVRAADASPVRVFYNDVTVLGGFPTKPLLKVLHPDPSRSGELCTQTGSGQT